MIVVLVVLAVVTAVLAAYAGGVTVLMVEAVRAVKESAKVVEQEAVSSRPGQPGHRRAGGVPQA